MDLVSATATYWRKHGRCIKAGAHAVRINGAHLYYEWDTVPKKMSRKIYRPGVLKRHR